MLAFFNISTRYEWPSNSFAVLKCKINNHRIPDAKDNRVWGTQDIEGEDIDIYSLLSLVKNYYKGSLCFWIRS